MSTVPKTRAPVRSLQGLMLSVALTATAGLAAPACSFGQDGAEQRGGLEVKLHAFDDGWLLYAPAVFAVSVTNRTAQPHWFNGASWTFHCTNLTTGKIQRVAGARAYDYANGVCEHMPLAPGETRLFLITATRNAGGLGEGEWDIKLEVLKPSWTGTFCPSVQHPKVEPVDLVRQTAPIVSDRLRIRVTSPRTKADREAAGMIEQHVASLEPDAGDLFSADPDFEPPTRLIDDLFWRRLRTPTLSFFLFDWEKEYAAYTPEEGFPGLAGLLVRAKHPASGYARAVAVLLLLGTVEVRYGGLDLDHREDAADVKACEELFKDLEKRWPEYARGELVSYLRIHFDFVCGRTDQAVAGAAHFALAHPDSPLRVVIEQLLEKR